MIKFVKVLWCFFSVCWLYCAGAWVYFMFISRNLEKSFSYCMLLVLICLITNFLTTVRHQLENV